jgi:hypothetical protein
VLQHGARPTIHVGDFRHHHKSLDLRGAMHDDAPVSSILLQENRFSPLSSAGFFLAGENDWPGRLIALILD